MYVYMLTAGDALFFFFVHTASVFLVPRLLLVTSRSGKVVLGRRALAVLAASVASAFFWPHRMLFLVSLCVSMLLASLPKHVVAWMCAAVGFVQAADTLLSLLGRPLLVLGSRASVSFIGGVLIMSLVLRLTARLGKTGKAHGDRLRQLGLRLAGGYLLGSFLSTAVSVLGGDVDVGMTTPDVSLPMCAAFLAWCVRSHGCSWNDVLDLVADDSVERDR